MNKSIQQSNICNNQNDILPRPLMSQIVTVKHMPVTWCNTIYVLPTDKHISVTSEYDECKSSW